jgi:hypothetical protein
MSLHPRLMRHLIKWVKQYPHSAVSSVRIRPTDADRELYGQHASFVMDKVRYWFFELESGRDKFKKDFTR